MNVSEYKATIVVTMEGTALLMKSSPSLTEFVFDGEFLADQTIVNPNDIPIACGLYDCVFSVQTDWPFMSEGDPDFQITIKDVQPQFTPAIESGHDFLERKLKEGWRLEASDMTNCLAALLDEYGQRTPAPIRDELLKSILVSFLDGIRDYEHEGGPSIKEDERESSEFVEIFMDSDDYRHVLKCNNSALAQAKKEGEWISVDERLPEKGQTILARLEGDVTKRIVYYVLKRVAEKNVTWRAADDNSEVSCAFNVTHWQPLPAPPKTEGQ